MSLFGDILGLVSGFGKKTAISNATDAQVNGYRQGQNVIGAENNRIQGLYQPYAQNGDGAVNAEGDLLGVNGNQAQQQGINSLRSSPLFQSLYQQGLDSTLQNASATGGLRGGNAQHDLYQLGSNTLAQVIQQQLANLGGLSGQGLSAINNSGQLGANAADNQASLFGAIGQTQAGGILGREGVNQQLWQTGAQGLQDLQNTIMQAFGGGFPGFGGGGGGFSAPSNPFASAGPNVQAFLGGPSSFGFSTDLPY